MYFFFLLGYTNSTKESVSAYLTKKRSNFATPLSNQSKVAVSICLFAGVHQKIDNSFWIIIKL